MTIETSFLVETAAPPAAAFATAAVAFYLAWFRTRKRSLFSDTHGSRWDVAGLALALIAALGLAHSWELFSGYRESLAWTGYAAGAVLVYLLVAAVFRLPEPVDSTAICVFGIAAIALSLNGFAYLSEESESTVQKYTTIALLAAGAFVVATSFAFLAWRLEAVDVFLTSLGYATPAAAYLGLHASSVSGASTYGAFVAVSLAGLFFTLTSPRKIRLTLSYGLFFGLFASAVLLYFAAAAARPPAPLAAASLALGAVLPAAAAIHPSIAENRRLSKWVLPCIALAVTSVALLAGTGAAPDTGGY